MTHHGGGDVEKHLNIMELIYLNYPHSHLIIPMNIFYNETCRCRQMYMKKLLIYVICQMLTKYCMSVDYTCHYYYIIIY